MASIDELAAFFGGKRLEDSDSESTTGTIYGTAVSDSENGVVKVIISDDTIVEDGTNVIELPTTANILEGDDVVITTVGAIIKTPLVTGTVGGGDRIADTVEGVKQYFFADDEGAHVSTVENDATVGANMLATSTGVYMRDGLTKMTGHTKNGFVVFNTEGDGALAKVSADGIEFNAALFNEETGQFDLLPLFEMGKVGGLGFKAPYGTIGTRSEEGIDDPEYFPGPNSFTFGEGLYAPNENQVAIGQWNAKPSQLEVFSIGCGMGPGHEGTRPPRLTVFSISAEGDVKASSVSCGSLTVSGKPITTYTPPEVLYADETGTLDTVTLSKSSAGYEYLEIFYKDASGTYGSVKIYQPDGKRVDLSTEKYAVNAYASYARCVTISGNKITTVDTGDGEWHGRLYVNSKNTPAITANRNISITRVIGYK